jgi:hypothetical protein
VLAWLRCNHMIFESNESAIAYIEAEIQNGIPCDWTSHRRLQYRFEQVAEENVTLDQTEWKLAPPQDPRELPSRDFLVRLSGDRNLLAIIHGNSDSGGSVFNWIMQKATLIHVQDLQYHPLRDFLRHLISAESPNTWGLS